ncbi:hypothetical protein JCM10212_000689 [Sporobolomyces blumeae]
MASLLDVDNLEPPTSRPEPPQPQLQGVPTAQRVRTIRGHPTNVLVQAFRDRVMVTVTQLGKIGCIIQCTPPPAHLPAPVTLASDPTRPRLPPINPSTTLTPLFGVAPTPHLASLHDLYALQISSVLFDKLARESHGIEVKPVVLAIGLKKSPSDDLRERDATANGDSDDGSRHDDDDDDDDGSGGAITAHERDTFNQVVEMVVECVA